MNILQWLKCRFAGRGTAWSLCRQGMARATRHDHQGAINDYTASIEMPDAPVVVKAFALFHRALMHVATGDFTKGVEDLDVVLAMEKAPANLKRMARKKLAKRESRSSDANV
jgi:hypothetical protein